MSARDQFPSMLPRGMSAAQAMAYLGLKRRTFDRIKGELRKVRLGTSDVYDREELDNLFDRLTGRPVGAIPRADDREAELPLSVSLNTNTTDTAQPKEKKWAASRASTSTKKRAATGSTSAFVGYDYATISQAIKRLKTG